MTDVTVTET